MILMIYSVLLLFIDAIAIVYCVFKLPQTIGKHKLINVYGKQKTASIRKGRVVAFAIGVIIANLIYFILIYFY